MYARVQQKHSGNDWMKPGGVLQFQGETATVARATVSAYFRNSDVRKSRTRVARKGKEIPLVPYREFRMDIRLSHGGDVRRSARASCNWRAYFPHTSIVSPIGAIVFIRVWIYPHFGLISHRELITIIVAAKPDRMG